MTGLHPLPLRTSRFIPASIAASDFRDIDLIISAGHATEDRGQLPLWGEISSASPERVAWVSQIDKETIRIHGSVESTLKLSDQDALDSLLNVGSVLIDVSGLSHEVWAPLLRSAFSTNVQTKVLYAEPDSYKEHPNPASASLFDLSVTFAGLSPLPGFAQLSGPPDENRCLFVAMLGFEGNRPQYLAFQLDPPPKVIPIVGVPGFQMEYPAFTVTSNRDFLEEFRAHAELRYARASCPFEAMDALDQILTDYPDYYLYIAPVGTKPHAVGCILFALLNPGSTEIMFDHPVRKAGRTKGIGVIHLYDLGCLNDLRP